MEENRSEIEAFKEQSRVRSEAGAEGSSEYEARMLEAFVGKPERPEKGLWYANAFSKYTTNGIETIRWNWSWWAFFGGIWFLIYRKAYAAAGGLFLLSIIAAFIPFAGVVVWVLSGGYSVFFVYRVYRIKKLQIEAAEENEEQRIEMMRELGGYNQWVVILAVILNAVALLGIIAAIAVGVTDGSAEYQGY